ncbi:MAG: ribosome small subunit-dependent GTPase A [Planctomycetes bacterium]|nr:ribosome small subunit-dependent GTPase A [Planctomycetota bacterium]
MNLERLGFSGWYQDRIDPCQGEKFEIARVTTVHRDGYVIVGEKGTTSAKSRGKLKFAADSALALPTVGDWVYVKYPRDDSFAAIQAVFPRKTLLKRKTAGKRVEFQLIAANIDVALIIQSLDANYNLRRLERYLVMVNESHIQPVVSLSKRDLVHAEELAEKVAETRTVMPEVRIVTFSNTERSGLEEIEALLKPDQTYCLLGSSGVGKTTLLNNLLGEERLETQAVREKDGKGRHTTSARELILLKNGSLIVDTPGMRELGNIDVEVGLSETFDDIELLATQCRFRDCSHTKEQGCAILAAIEKREISLARYDNYEKMARHAARHEASQAEKRRSDKKSGRFYKTVMKHNVKKRWS